MKLVSALLLLGLCAGTARAICETYVVGPGDTVLTIAAKFNVQKDDLEAAITTCDANYAPGGILTLNQAICLPPTFSACQYVRIAGTEANCKYYVIQSGDTLETIAMNLGLLRLDLEALNPERNQLQVNQFVKLTGWTDNCPAPGNNQACRYYIAGSGDSLSAVATSFSVDLEQLKEVNTELAADTNAIIQPGMRVKIPPFTEGCGEGVAVKKPVIGNCNAYKVVAGDTLYTIAAAFQTTFAQLAQVNPAVADGVLTVGSEIFIPPYVEADCVNGKNIVQAGQIVYQIAEGEAAQTPAVVEGAPDELEVAASPAPAPASRRMKA